MVKNVRPSLFGAAVLVDFVWLTLLSRVRGSGRGYCVRVGTLTADNLVRGYRVMGRGYGVRVGTLTADNLVIRPVSAIRTRFSL